MERNPGKSCYQVNGPGSSPPLRHCGCHRELGCPAGLSWELRAHLNFNEPLGVCDMNWYVGEQREGGAHRGDP